MQAGLSGGVSSVREVPDGYLFFADQIVAVGEDFQTHAVIWRLDEVGDVISITDQFPGNPRQSNFGIWDSVDELPNGLFAVPVIDNWSGYDRGIYIHLVNGLGDTVQTYHPIQYLEEDSAIVTMRDLVVIPDGHYMIAGSVDSLPNELDTNCMLAKVSPEGDLLWMKEYQVPDELHAAADIAPYANGGVVVFGYRLGQGIWDKNFVMRVDSDGNLLWRRYMGDVVSPSYGAVAVDANGDIITWSRYSAEWDTYDWKLQLIKWDPDGNIIWDSRTHLDYANSPYDMYIQPDGGIIASARVDYQGAICKFSANGDSVWTRTYNLFTYSATHTLFDVEPTADGGIMAAGEVSQGGDDPEPGLQTLWMIRMDSLRCVVPGCHTVGVAEYELGLQEALVLQPNPASDHLEFNLPLPVGYQLSGAVQAVVLDAQGKEVLRQGVSINATELRSTLDVRSLPAGLYYMHLRDEVKWLAGGKVVVE